jgi:hypothetical protein
VPTITSVDRTHSCTELHSFLVFGMPWIRILGRRPGIQTKACSGRDESVRLKSVKSKRRGLEGWEGPQIMEPVLSILFPSGSNLYLVASVPIAVMSLFHTVHPFVFLLPASHIHRRNAQFGLGYCKRLSNLLHIHAGIALQNRIRPNYCHRTLSCT